MCSLSLLTYWTLVLAFVAGLNFSIVLSGDGFVSSIVDTYDLLYNKGVEAYARQRWFECLTHLNGALTDYRVYRSTLITCKRECRKKSSSDDGTLSSKPQIAEMQIFFRILKRSNCLRKCKQNHFGNRPDVKATRVIEEEFESRKPYDFLQFCHYKLDNIKEAVASSYTYLMANPKHESTLKNLLYYQRLPGIVEDHFIDMERRIYQSLFIKAQDYQMAENWKGVLDTIEPAVHDFIKEVDSCELLCEGTYNHEAFPEFINAIADHYVNVLKCQTACEDKVSFLHGEKMDGFLPEMYNYLQFAYYQLNDVSSAVKAVASYLLFKPEDASMQENKRIYIQKGASPDEIVPRPEAMDYYLHAKQKKSMLKFVKENYVFPFEDENEESDDVSEPPPPPPPPPSTNEKDQNLSSANSNSSEANNLTSAHTETIPTPSDASSDTNSPQETGLESESLPHTKSESSQRARSAPDTKSSLDSGLKPLSLQDAGSEARSTEEAGSLSDASLESGSSQNAGSELKLPLDTSLEAGLEAKLPPDTVSEVKAPAEGSSKAELTASSEGKTAAVSGSKTKVTVDGNSKAELNSDAGSKTKSPQDVSSKAKTPAVSGSKTKLSTDGSSKANSAPDLGSKSPSTLGTDLKSKTEIGSEVKSSSSDSPVSKSKSSSINSGAKSPSSDIGKEPKSASSDHDSKAKTGLNSKLETKVSESKSAESSRSQSSQTKNKLPESTSLNTKPQEAKTKSSSSSNSNAKTSKVQKSQPPKTTKSKPDNFKSQKTKVSPQADDVPKSSHSETGDLKDAPPLVLSE